jgi:hypothetical protein
MISRLLTTPVYGWVGGWMGGRHGVLIFGNRVRLGDSDATWAGWRWIFAFQLHTTFLMKMARCY